MYKTCVHGTHVFLHSALGSISTYLSQIKIWKVAIMAGAGRAVSSSGSSACGDAADAIISTPSKGNQKKLTMLVKQVLDLSQIEVDSGEFNADLCMAESLISSLRRNRSMVKELWGRAQTLEQSQTVQGAEGVDIFNCSTLQGLPPDWKFGWLVKNGDFTAEDLLGAQEKLSTAVSVLMEYATQLGGHMKLPDNCRYEPVVDQVMNQQHSSWGARLKDFKKQGGFTEDGGLNFAKMCYRPLWGPEGQLQEIQHVGGLAVKVDKVYGSKIDRNYQLKDNCNDASACFVLDPFPPIPLIGFFKDKPTHGGPNAGRRFIGKKAQVNFAEFVGEIRTSWLKNRVSMSNTSVSSDLSTPMKEVMQKKRAAHMSQAQQRAKALIAERGAVKTVVFS